MARGLVAWVAGVLLACAGVAVAYLPPRGVPEERAAPGGGPPPSRDRLRATALAREWRAADRAVRLAEDRERLRAQLTARRAAGTLEPLLVLDTALAPAAQAAVAAQLGRVWRSLGLGASKISVALIVVGETPVEPLPEGLPARERSRAAAFLMPDSTDRHACVTQVPVSYWSRRALEQPDTVRGRQLEAWLRSGLGPCAFYAAFGRPSREIEGWLRRRGGLQFAAVPTWDRPLSAMQRMPWYLQHLQSPQWRDQMWWWIHTQHSFSALSCLGGREEACRRSVMGVGLVGGSTYLSDLLREVGPERFKRFWTADVPVDSAFHAAIGEEIGVWTSRWQRQLGVRLPLGPAVPPGAAALGTLVAVLALVAVALQAERRSAG